jgi:hypothetical protein
MFYDAAVLMEAPHTIESASCLCLLIYSCITIATAWKSHTLRCVASAHGGTELLNTQPFLARVPPTCCECQVMKSASRPAIDFGPLLSHAVFVFCFNLSSSLQFSSDEMRTHRLCPGRCYNVPYSSTMLVYSCYSCFYISITCLTL